MVVGFTDVVGFVVVIVYGALVVDPSVCLVVGFSVVVGFVEGVVLGALVVVSLVGLLVGSPVVVLKVGGQFLSIGGQLSILLRNELKAAMRPS